LRKLRAAGANRRVTDRYRRALADFPYIEPENIRRAVVLTHRHADVDAYCAAYGVARLLRRLKRGARVTVVAPEGLSIPARRVRSRYPLRLAEKTGFEDVDLAVVVDTGNLSLLARFAAPLSEATCLKVFLDHHPLNRSIEEVADHLVLDETASSVSEIVYRLLATHDVPLTRDLAQVLLTGIVADSRHLRLATSRTVRAVAEICDRGASIGVAADILGSVRDQSERIARLKGAQRVSLYRIGNWLAGSTEIGSYQSSVARALVDLGVDFAAAIGETGGQARCCLRATQSFCEGSDIHLGRDIAERIAERLGGVGGGHPAAASLTVTASSEEVSKSVLDAVEAATGLEVERLK
jgi:nanoRNase/pAp phosphatase (c-di-AMP/oligoRNAs hydrolase)